jgi:hypothetical protein
LRAIGGNASYAATRIRSPQRSIALGKNALRALQINAHITDSAAVHGKTVKRIDAVQGYCHLRSLFLKNASSALLAKPIKPSNKMPANRSSTPIVFHPHQIVSTGVDKPT